MQKLKLTDLVLRKQARYELTEIKKFPIIGYDTETKDGLAHLICNCQGDYINPYSIDDCLAFLCRKSTRSKVGFFYNLKYDVQAILKWLEPEHWEELYRDGETIYEKWTINYIPKKLLVISYKNGKKKRTWRFYDIFQYFRMTLDNAAHKYLGKEKLKHPFDLANLQMHDFIHPTMIEYCVRDAYLTRRLATRWIYICFSQDLRTKNFCSPASVACRFFMKETKLPTINAFLKNDKKKKQLEYAWNSVSGAFISVYQKGYFPEIYEYDINSAYPYQMSNIPDLTRGYFSFAKRGLPKNAHLGWLRARIKIEYDEDYYFHPPFPILRKNLPNYYPIGEYETYITLSEFNFYKKYYDIKPLSGLYWIPEKEIEYPFRETIQGLYKRRKATKDPNINFFIKIILNGIYGKFLEKHPIHDKENINHGKLQIGNLFNPFIASYILADTRIQVFEAMTKIPKNNLIACFTDSVLTTEKLNIPLGEKLGEWDFATKGEALILGCGVYTIRGEKLKNKMRGFDISDKEKYNLFALCKKFYNKETLEIDITENISPLKSIIQNRPADMNKILEGLKTVNINFDSKRVWKYYPKTAGEYLENQISSEPFFNLGGN